MYTVTAQRRVAAPVPEVWRFLSEPERFGRWFADVTPWGPGQPFRLDFGDGDFHVGRVVEWLPDNALGVRWRVLGVGPEYRVLFSLLARGDGTEVTVQDRGALTSAEAQCLRLGWSEFLLRLERAACRGERARFEWRRMITFTGRVADRARLLGALGDASWYGRAFDGASVRAVETAGAAGVATADEDPGGVLRARLGHERWGDAETHLEARLDTVAGTDYLSVVHDGFHHLPAALAAAERSRFVPLWLDAAAALAVS